MRLSEPFAIKFINHLFKATGQNVITSTINWLLDSKYRRYMKLNKWISNQIELCDESDNFSRFYTQCMMSIPQSHRTNPAKLIVGILKYVHKNIAYSTDINNFGQIENWEDLTETIRRKKGDCENQNALIYVIARTAGIPYFLLWNCIGLSSEGHYWLVYFNPKTAEFFSIDSTYKPNLSQLAYRQPFKIGIDYKKIYFIFNEEHVFKPK